MGHPVLVTVIGALAVAGIAGGVQAGEMTCKGNITSIQGEGLVARPHRFEVEGVSGSDLSAVLKKCGEIAKERQNKAARRNPGGNFRRSSEVDLQCVQDGEKVPVRRTIQTGP